MEDNVTKITRQ